VGKSALEGLKGIKRITKAFRGIREINTVFYDPEKISVERMEEALKQAGTYVGTVKP
jgi:hypothetical protein